MYDKLIAAIPATQRKRAEKCVVRECDEIEKETFIAYIDEGSETFDVSLTFKDQFIVTSSCDCKQKTALCQHKAALLLYIANPPTKKASTVKAKKTDPMVSLLATIESGDLKKWLESLLLNNKDIRLAFELQFAPQASLTVEDIIERTKSAVKTVVKNKKNVDVNQLKKIIDLWLKIHEPVLKEYYGAVYTKNAFLKFHAALKTCSLEYERMITLSNKILVYIGERVNQSIEPIRDLVHEDQWQASIDLLFDGMQDATHYLKMCYLGLLKNLIDVTTTDRGETLLRQMMARYRQILSIHPAYQEEVGTFFLDIIVSKGVFHQYKNSFSAIDYAAAYNTKLVDGLVTTGDFEMAEKICLLEIKFHAKNPERIVYYDWLVRIYELTGEMKKKVDILQRQFPLTLSYRAFKTVYDSRQDKKERATWRSTALRHVEYPSKQFEKQAYYFRLALATDEADVAAATRTIENGCVYSAIDQLKEPLFKVLGDSFIHIMMNRYDYLFEDLGVKQFNIELEAATHLAQFFIQQYDVLTLQHVLKQAQKKNRGNNNQFVAALEEALAVSSGQ